MKCLCCTDPAIKRCTICRDFFCESCAESHRQAFPADPQPIGDTGMLALAANFEPITIEEK